MRYQLLGRTGLRVSEVALGAMTFGETWGPMGASSDVARAIFDRYLEAGGNVVDTANNYQGGESERFVGRFLEGRREQVVLASKYTLAERPGDPNGWGNHRKNMVQTVEASLKRLGTDRLDLLWLHIWDFTTPVEEVVRGLEDLARAGKILHAGASDTPAWVVAEANTIAGFRGWLPFAALQVEYNLLQRTVEHELLPLARSFGLGVFAWSPLAMGVLTGKYAKDPSAAGSGRAAWVAERLRHPRVARVVETLLAVARETGQAPARVAINWLRAVRPQGPAVVPILGARTLEQFDDLLAALTFRLTPEQVARLDEASAIEPIFPANMWRDPDLVRDIVTGGTQDLIDGWSPR